MALCTKCEESMVSDEADMCRDCILDENEELIDKLVKRFKNKNLRQLMISHSEARNQIIQERVEEEH